MGKRIIITAGPTNERIDAVMQITNMSTGALGCRIATKILTEPAFNEQLDRLYYISPKLAYKPDYPNQDGKLILVRADSADELLDALTHILTEDRIDAVVHNAAVGDYKAKYSVRGEDLAHEIAEQIQEALQDSDPMDGNKLYNIIMSVLDNPNCAADDSTKMSSYEPHLLTMMTLTPKVIGVIKSLSPDTMLIGSKLLENVPKQELFAVASHLRQKNKADYIIANDLAQIGDGKHPAMIIGYDGIAERDAIFAEPGTKDEIANEIAKLIFGNSATLRIGTP